MRRRTFAMKQHILVVEDDEKTATLIQIYLENAGYAVTKTHNGSDGLRLARELLPDLVVLDLMLPEVDGLVVCRMLQEEQNIPVVMLTARSTEDDVLLGLETGADDYIVKPFSPREVVARVKTVLRRIERNGGQKSLTFGALHIDVERHQVTHNGEEITVTPKEFQLLVTLARDAGRVFSRAELVEKAFGYEYEALDRTIDTHILNLRRKIEPNPTEPQYILTVFGVGYRFVESS